MAIERREFLKRAGLIGGAAAAATLPGCRRLFQHLGFSGRSMLERPATLSGIDHVVVVMMENRSFDHWLGWMAEDHAFLEAGRRRYGRKFSTDGKPHQTILGSATGPVQTTHLLEQPGQTNPYRGCDHGDPGHSWTQGRAQRDGGFLAQGSRNDLLATGFYEGADLPFTSKLASRFTTFDRYHASLLGPTYPNRAYLHSASSGGNKDNTIPLATGGYPMETIWERLTAASVPAKYYYGDLPVLALWGSRMLSYLHPATDYFADCAAGTLPSVSYLDPKFSGLEQNDDHPLADIRRGQAFLRDAFEAFVESPNWESGLFVVTYDEWGGFFDHVPPPHFQDDRASAVDLDDFGQAGFRVPTVVASPFSRPGYVDHRSYDHSSVLRFLEWRFLGAPPEGPGKAGDSWFLTKRDRNANNLGSSLLSKRWSPDVGFDLDVHIDPGSPLCAPPTAALRAAAADPEDNSMEDLLDSGFFERVGAPVYV